MAEGGFLIKIDGKKKKRCYAVAFDYDKMSYTVNAAEKKSIPKRTKKIEIIIE